MYPTNAASPQRLAIGPVVQISDGAVQTSGVSVKVLPQGGVAGAGGGTTGYEEGIVHYLPTQAETNYASFVVIAYKTGCIPACITVVTSASGTAGYAGVDWSKVTAPTTTLNLSGTTIKTATDVETDTADIQTRIPAALVSGRIDASVGAMATDVITSTALAASAVTEIQTGLSTLDAAGVRTAVGLASANLDTQLDALPTAAENATAVLTTQMTEAYRADGAAPTLAQGVCETLAHLGEAAISGTTKTLKKFDGTTTAATFTLDSSTTPTSITRAT